MRTTNFAIVRIAVIGCVSATVDFYSEKPTAYHSQITISSFNHRAVQRLGARDVVGQDFSRWGRLVSSDRAGAADGCSRYGGRDGSWTGFYVGGHVGYSRGNARVNLVDDDPTNFKSSFGSLFGGLQGGYNYVLPSRFLLGIEADASFPNYLSADDVVWSRTTPNTDIAEKID